MLSIDPKWQVSLNFLAGILLVNFGYVDQNGLPAPWSPEASHIVQAQSHWFSGFLAAIVAFANGGASLFSSSKPGPLASK